MKKLFGYTFPIKINKELEVAKLKGRDLHKELKDVINELDIVREKHVERLNTHIKEQDLYIEDLKDMVKQQRDFIFKQDTFIKKLEL